MSGNKSKCEVCDGTEYYTDSGFFYCEECHTQAKGVVETEFDIDISSQMQSITVNKKKPGGNQLKQVTEGSVAWTSWEGHNFVLIGLVDELIALGADPELKLLVLQLWSKYLNKLEAVFTSTTEQKLPKFWLNQPEKDYRIIFGMKKKKNARRKRFRKERGEVALDMNATLTDKRKVFLRMRRAVIREEYEQMRHELATTQNALSQVDDRLRQRFLEKSTPLTPTVEVEYSTEALRVLEMRRNCAAAKSDAEEEDANARRVNHVHPHRLTRLKLVAVLALALMLSTADIQISDLIRWMFEGRLSYLKVAHLFPRHVRFSRGDKVFLLSPTSVPSYGAILQASQHLAALLGVEAVPAPDMAALIRRYVAELNLPPGVARCAESLAPGSRSGEGEVADHEGLAMALVVVALKMMFGLDGATEHRISDFVKRIGSALGVDDLFDWDEWVAFVEWRKAVVLEEHFPTKNRLGLSLTTALDPYLDFMRAAEEKEAGVGEMFTCRSVQRTVRDAGALSESMEWCINQLPIRDAAVAAPTLQFPPSFTPLATYLDAIRGCPHRRGSLPAGLRDADFTKKSVDFLVDPERLVRLAREEGIHVEVRDARATEADDIVPVFRCTAKDRFKLAGKEALVCFASTSTVVPEQTPRPGCKRKRDEDKPQSTDNARTSRSARKKMGRNTPSLSTRKKANAEKSSKNELQNTVGFQVLRSLRRRVLRISVPPPSATNTNVEISPGNENGPQYTAGVRISRSIRKNTAENMSSSEKTTIKNSSGNVNKPQCTVKKQSPRLLLQKTAENITTLENTNTKNDSGNVNKFQCTAETQSSLSVRQRVGDDTRSTRRTNETVESEDVDPGLVLYSPHGSYWLLDCKDLHCAYRQQFEAEIEPRLPSTFRWLLAECAHLLATKTKDLYVQVLNVEAMLRREQEL